MGGYHSSKVLLWALFLGHDTA